MSGPLFVICPLCERLMLGQCSGTAIYPQPCSACEFDEAYPDRPSADVMAVEHVKSHGRWAS